MERLGIYIFYFFFFGLCFFERVRTKGETGTLWQVLFRNFAVMVFAVVGFFFIGIDMMFPADGFDPFRTAKSIINYRDPYGAVVPGARFSQFMQIWLDCLFCATASLIVAVGIWELKISRWNKWTMIAVFSILVYPAFGLAQYGAGFLGRMDFYDHAGALLIWALPAVYVLGTRLFVSRDVLPDERTHDLKGVKILPGMKERFFLGRGIGFTMIFLVLSATTLVNLPVNSANTKMLWAMSKTLTLIPASLTMLFCSFLFFGLFGRNKLERISYAPPFFAIMSALVATQSCNQYSVKEAVIAAVVATFVALVYLRLAPLKIRIWDPVCSLPIFLIGGIVGVLMACLTESAQLKPQLIGVATCVVFGGGVAALLTSGLRTFRKMDRVESDIEVEPDEKESATLALESEAVEEEPVEDDAPKKTRKKRFGRKS